MNKLFIKIVSFLGLFPFLFLSPNLAFASPRIIDLGLYNGGDTVVYAINNLNQVAGYCLVNLLPHACFYNGTNWVDLGTLGGEFSYAFGINDNDQIVGFSRTSSGATHGFLWQNGTMSELTSLSSYESAGSSINNQGQIAGYSYVDQTHKHATLWQNGSIVDLGTLPGGDISSANAINNVGVVIGTSNFDPTEIYHMFIWKDGLMTDVGLAGSYNTIPSSINDSNQVAGRVLAVPVPSTGPQAYFWSNGKYTRLPNLGTDPTVAMGINNIGVVVGYSTIKFSNTTHAYAWYNNQITDLGVLSNVFNTSQATSINQKGVIAGFSVDDHFRTHGVLWVRN